MKGLGALPSDALHVAVVLPCFNVERHIKRVISSVPEFVRTVIAVDDHSLDGTRAALAAIRDPRLVIVMHERNQGVGGAVLSGYQAALERNADVCVKMDGDGQMSPDDLPALLQPIALGEADYAKGNRFHDVERLATMPKMRLVGNGFLSFATKLVSGYWSIFDPTNGYTAIRSEVLRRLDMTKIQRRYFFETSMLVELNILGAVVQDVEMPARYGDETSSLRIRNVLAQFPPLLIRGLLRRFFWRYMIRDFNALTLCVLAGVPLVLFGLVFGLLRWWQSEASGVPATAGTVILAALPFLVGFQCLLIALVLDTLQQPSRTGGPATSGRSRSS